MASDLNRVVLIGRLTKDPELKYTPANTAVASFSLANNRSYVQGTEKKEQVSFFNCIAWAKTGEVIAQYCKKGKQIAVEGRIQQRSWDDKEGNKRSTVEIVVENFQFLGSAGTKGDDHSSSGSDVSTGDFVSKDSHQAPDNVPFSDEDIPF